MTKPAWNLHTPEEIGADDLQAQRGPEDKYRTTPLKSLWTHDSGGYYHDRRLDTLLNIVSHYTGFQDLGLGSAQRRDLVEYPKSR